MDSESDHEEFECEVELLHHSSLHDARWCNPVGWTPKNVIPGASWSETRKCWVDNVTGKEVAAVVLFGQQHRKQGCVITVADEEIRICPSDLISTLKRIEM